MQREYFRKFTSRLSRVLSGAGYHLGLINSTLKMEAPRFSEMC
jgi:hypothetical protein